MKTCQGTGYFRQVQLRLLLCFISSVVFAASAYAFTAPNNITACYDCHGSPIIPNGTDIRPVDSTYRNITTGGFVGSHRKHIASPTTAAITCTPCHGPAPAIMNHRDGKIEMTLTNPGTYSKGTFFNQTSLPVLGTCSNILCHSATTTPAVSTPTWGVSAGCAACHATTPPTGAHTIHMTAPISAACGTCHTGATIGTSGGPGHGNNLIDVSLYSPTTVAKHAPGAYTATCSTACHNAAGTTAVPRICCIRILRADPATVEQQPVQPADRGTATVISMSLRADTRPTGPRGPHSHPVRISAAIQTRIRPRHSPDRASHGVRILIVMVATVIRAHRPTPPSARPTAWSRPVPATAATPTSTLVAHTIRLPLETSNCMATVVSKRRAIVTAATGTRPVPGGSVRPSMPAV